MRADPLSAAISTSTTAPAGSRDEPHTTLPVRRVARDFSRLFREHQIAAHPAEVRQLAARFCASGQPMSAIEDVVIVYSDPTGEIASRNVDRARQPGGRDASS